VKELVRLLGMNKNMIYRALTTLAAQGYVTRDPSGERYQLGPQLFALGTAGASESDIVALSRPTLEQLHALTGESVYLSIIVGRNANLYFPDTIYLLVQMPPQEKTYKVVLAWKDRETLQKGDGKNGGSRND